MSLRNEDLSDRELLYAVNAVANKDGIAFGIDVAFRLGMGSYTRSDGVEVAPQAVAGRLSWMKRYGFLDRIDPKTLGFKANDPPGWIITPVGKDVMKGSLPQALVRSIQKANVGVNILIMRELMTQGYVAADESRAAALRREYANNRAKRG